MVRRYSSTMENPKGFHGPIKNAVSLKKYFKSHYSKKSKKAKQKPKTEPNAKKTAILDRKSLYS